MNILIAYASKYGCTEKCANILSENLKKDGLTVTVFDLAGRQKISLEDYGTVLIGGSIMVGKLNPVVKKFCENNLSELLKKKIGLFICAAAEELAEKEMADNFPKELLNMASAKGYFGYEYNFEKMNFAIRAIIKKMSKVENSVSNILEGNIKEFAENLMK
ncbi:MAG: flavodoxin [Actinobacteria bacterium]|nr:flavodoxin [Actinomycetota bacterium]